MFTGKHVRRQLTRHRHQTYNLSPGMCFCASMAGRSHSALHVSANSSFTTVAEAGDTTHQLCSKLLHTPTSASSAGRRQLSKSWCQLRAWNEVALHACLRNSHCAHTAAGRCITRNGVRERLDYKCASFLLCEIVPPVLVTPACRGQQQAASAMLQQDNGSARPSNMDNLLPV
jgi:hypothetical protein